MFIYSSLLQEDLQESQLLIGRVKVNTLSDPLALVNLHQYLGWRGNFLLSAAEQWLKHELTKNFKVIRDLELLPQLLGQDWSSVFLQRFDGAVTWVMADNREPTLNCTPFQNLAKDSTLGSYSSNLSLDIATSYWDRIGFDYFPIQTPVNWKEWFVLVSWWHGPR